MMMQPPTTLKGVFPDRPVIPRKNFIKENVRRIRQMQAEQQEVKVRSDSGTIHRSIGHHITSNLPLTSSKQMMPPQVNSQVHVLQQSNARQLGRRPGIQKLEIKPVDRPKVGSQVISDLIVNNNISHRSMQTELCDDPAVIYATGIIKYPTPTMPHSPPPRRRTFRRERREGREVGGNGDSPEVTSRNNNKMNSLETKVDYVKSNMMALKNRKLKADTLTVDPNKVPFNYKRGVTPKYIKSKKEEVEDTADVDCPPGHVLLPDEERKETLRVLRESYAEKVQEVNLMPVRSDTLKMQKRKMELEMELKKIDEGIKVFQRPKVFVKINV